MKIYQTINIGNEFEKIEEEIEKLQGYNIYGLRFNLCKYSYDDLENAINNILKYIEKYCCQYHFAFDLPYPKNKSRIVGYSIDNDRIFEKHEYTITRNIKNSEQTNIIYMDEQTLFNEKNRILYYGDGEGAFEVIEIKNDTIVVKALNTFQIHKQKSITCGDLSNRHICFKVVKKILNIKLKYNPIFFFSFVENKEQILEFKNSFRDKKNCFDIISKIESVNDRTKIKEIINESSGALLARGDMAMLLPMIEMLNICRFVTKECLKSDKRIFLATDVLSSLNMRKIPTRADIIDIQVALEMGCTDVIIPYGFKEKGDFIKYIEYFSSTSSE